MFKPAMADCRACGATIAKSARTCPSCGIKKPGRGQVATNRKSVSGSTVILTIVAVIVVVVVFGNSNSERVSQHQESSLASKYEANWNTYPLLAISQSLVKSNIRNCGEYKYKQSRTHSGEYVVYCTGDGINWVSYLVWTGTKKVMGPYKTDPSLGA